MIFLSILTGVFLIAFLLTVDWSSLSLRGQRLRRARSSIQLSQAIADPELSTRYRDLLHRVADLQAFAASVFGVASARDELRFLPGCAEDHLLYVVRAAAPLRNEEYTWGLLPWRRRNYRIFFRKADAEKEVQHLKEAGWNVWLQGSYRYQPWTDAAAPVIPVMMRMNAGELALWYFREVLDAELGSYDREGSGEQLKLFLAKSAVKLYLSQRMGGNSAEFEDFHARDVDTRTFGLLLGDIRQQILDLYSLDLPENEVRNRREFLVKAWLVDYRSHYPERFVGNTYRDFGKEGIGSAFLLHYRTEGRYDARFAAVQDEAGGSLAALLRVLKNMPPDAEDPLEWITTRSTH